MLVGVQISSSAPSLNPTWGAEMTVKVINNKTGETFRGKFAVLRESEINLFSGIMSDKKGGSRGCGKKRVFPRQDVTVEVDNPSLELKGS